MLLVTKYAADITIYRFCLAPNFLVYSGVSVDDYRNMSLPHLSLMLDLGALYCAVLMSKVLAVYY